MTQKEKHTWFDNLNLIFVMAVLVSYIIVAPFLLVQEYKHNNDFKEWLSCEEDLQEKIGISAMGDIITIKNSCKEIQKLSDNANIILLIAMLFWLGVIIEKDIYPNKEKIKKWLKDHYIDD